MKIKVKPDDFIVEERAGIDFKQGEKFKVYLLIKKNLTTFSVLRRLAKKLKLSLDKFSYGGKKDKYAFTLQYITIKDFKIDYLKERNFELKYLGDSTQPMKPSLILENNFKVIVRDLEEKEIDLAFLNLEFTKKYGFPNYFDDQRFRSFSPLQGFFAEKLIKKEFSGALKIYLTTIYPNERKEERSKKEYFFNHWKKWNDCLLRADNNFEKKVFRLLLEKKSFLEVLHLISKEELKMFISCFQSYLWNNLVERLIKFYSPELLKYKGSYWNYFFYNSKEVFSLLKDKKIPLASQKTKMPDEISQNFYGKILAERNLKSSFFNLRKFRKVYFKPTLRNVIILPKIKEISILDDELYKNKKAIFLNFSLARGSYGTMFIKRLFAC